jgi:hypothetical protein
MAPGVYLIYLLLAGISLVMKRLLFDNVGWIMFYHLPGYSLLSGLCALKAGEVFVFFLVEAYVSWWS